ncbi:LolA family protein [Rivibacter subsaxonicus]|uniref:Outer membrane lipoprotein carrier protein LolA n=1 Tax=Rivibacter subsaxonicus TaxID=457575 RepID=A0A4Q7W1J0_9BURK|nr:outer membrane lipoprotein carrier protein LolA [Rivibacter subsaxonicus]RZU03010.1 outer membrane lipoprotein carrier protein LolA [Rivibacter subsaxonicus]
MSGLLHRRALLALLASIASLPGAASAATLVEAVQARLANRPPALHGEFEQQRTLRGAKRALVSRGEFLILRDRGVLWRTREPAASSLVITPTTLRAVGADGRVQQQLDVARVPGLKEFTQLMLALLAGDLGALSTQFRIDGELLGAHGWTLVLEPLAPAVAAQMARVRVEGDGFVQQVTIDEAGGDRVQIRFSAQRPAAEATPAELALLEGA